MKKIPSDWSKLSAVLAHDWLTGMRGGERVLELLCEGFPTAPIYTLIHNRQLISQRINSHAIRTSLLQKVPGIMKYYRYFLPFFPSAMSHMHPPDADLLISTSHCVAKGIKPSPGTRHLCYCFTPMRYAWMFYDEYFGRNPLKRAFVEPVLQHLRKWDKKACERVTRFVAISQHVQGRIESCYGRHADVVYPPIDTEYYTPDPSVEPEEFDLVVSALVPYKRIDLAVEAYNELGYPLKIVGTGTESDKLQSMADPHIQFLGWQPDETIRDLYRRCRCLVFPGQEDFGLVPLEAQACGRPVVAFSAGGALESLEEDVSCIYFEDQSPGALVAAIEDCASRTWDTAAIRRNAERFSIQHFLDAFAKSIYLCLKDQKG